MTEEQSALSRMRAITVSREYGSGGGEIARRLAGHLGWQLIDHEVVVRVARELAVSEAEVEVHDERTEGLLSRILNSLQVLQPTIPMALPLAATPQPTDPQIYHEALSRVVEAAVNTGHVVIVGRGSQVLLASRRDVLHLRVVAPLEQRIAYVMQREGLDQADARLRIELKDRDRLRYLQTMHHQHPEDSHLYDLIVNTAILDLDSIVDLIILALERKAKRVSAPTQELGPGVGLERYPGQPGDYRLPESLSSPEEGISQ